MLEVATNLGGGFFRFPAGLSGIAHTSLGAFDGADQSHREQMWIARAALFFKRNFRLLESIISLIPCMLTILNHHREFTVPSRFTVIIQIHPHYSASVDSVLAGSSQCRLGAGSVIAAGGSVPAGAGPVLARAPPVPARSPPVAAHCLLGSRHWA